MPVSHRHRAIFVHIPRTAGGSIEQVLGICGDDNRGALKPARPDLLFGQVGNKALQHLTAREIRERVGERAFREYFKFAFVRNPYERTVSVYHVQCRDLRLGMSFRDFVLKRVVKGRPRGLRALFRSRPEKTLEDQFDLQADYVLDGKGDRLVDYVGKFESLAADYKTICDRLGVQAPLPRANRSDRGDYRTYYDSETKRVIDEVYAKDFESFGYVQKIGGGS